LTYILNTYIIQYNIERKGDDMVDINELSDIDPTRVDLVRYPAVRSAKYLLFKSEKRRKKTWNQR